MKNLKDIVCIKCKETYVNYEGNFTRNSSSASGYCYTCKSCKAKHSRMKREELKQQVMLDSGAWTGSQERKAFQNYKNQTI